ncbi:uncharacterized protein LOC126606898 [Malus sylvestris]|uniref:uncharacterized protein LOC126606898 n=1 Tax=Malus sylvestris TaxID=3752 RepID=UPI0010AA9E19|nr:uncharacterized protein LOC114826026 [Malus domestica]XP_050130281.1 uncharacterized protein LOC126606898 [Malus sylvestris]
MHQLNNGREHRKSFPTRVIQKTYTFGFAPLELLGLHRHRVGLRLSAPPCISACERLLLHLLLPACIYLCESLLSSLPCLQSWSRHTQSRGVRSCYDEGKRVAETLMFDYHRQHGIEIRIASLQVVSSIRVSI